MQPLSSNTPTNALSRDLSGLIAAVARTKAEGGLGQFLEDYRWPTLAPFLHPHVLARSHLLISQGDHDRKLYFVESGNLKVDMKVDAGLVQLAIVGPGSVVGEGSFFSQRTRNASVSAYSDSRVWSMNPEDFDELSRQQPRMALALAMAVGAVLASRMLDIGQRIAIT